MSIEQKSTAPATKERLGTIPRQAGAPAPVQRRNDTPARAAKAIVGLCATATVGALAAAALAGVGSSSPTIGAYGSMASSTASANVAGFPMTSGGLQLDGLLVRPDTFSADFSGVVRLTWTGAEAVTGRQSFSVAVRKEGRQVASLSGAIADVAPGATVSVPVASTDRYVPGPLQFSLGTGVTELNAQGTLNTLAGLTMVEGMRNEARASVERAVDSRVDFLGDWRWAS